MNAKNAKELIEAATPSGVLIAAAEDLKNRARQGGSQPTMTSDLWLAQHILSTVRPDDDEPVTRESCLAMGARIFGPRRYGFEVDAGQAIVVDMTESDVVESEVYIMDDEHRVTLKWNPTNHDLRRLVAALGE